MEPSVYQGAGKASVVQIIYAARSILNRALSRPEHRPGEFVPHLIELASFLMHACERDRNIVLATVLLRQDGPYAIRHAVNVAMLAELALRDIGLAASHRRPVVCAALTMNISMLALQEALSRQAGTLTQEQRLAMQSHPKLGREMLMQLGVNEPLWLDCVAQHHEAPDGKGYPQHLQSDQIRLEARLIAMLDRYCALLSRNAWRRGQGADSALFTTISEACGDLDVKLGHLLTRTLGIYPPGTLVQLINGEKGIVRRQGQTMPVVAALLDRNGCKLPTLLERDTARENYSIVSVLDLHQETERIDLQKIWGAEAADPV